MDNQDIARVLMEEVSFALTTLHLSGHIENVEVGVNPEEQAVTQRIRFDVEIHLSGAGRPEEDEIDRVLDYDFIRARVSEQVRGDRVNLLETLVADLLDSLLSPPEVVAATVSATKLDVYPDGAEIGCRMTRLKR